MNNIGDEGAGSGAVPLWLIIYTVALYAGFFVAFGNALPSFTFDCSGLVSCYNGIIGAIAAFFTVLTLGGFASPLPLALQGILLLIMALGWIPIFIRWITNAIEALLTGVP